VIGGNYDLNNPSWIRAIMRWTPALALMAAIFLLSATPSDEMVNFGVYDLLVKKGSHMVGYGLLALAFLRGLGYQRKNHILLVVLLVFLYAASDEFHQSFVPGRNASLVDVGIDLVGAVLALFASRWEFVRRLVMMGVKAG
jgi:VanZ family protein